MPVPRFLHEVFGSSQTRADIALVVVAATGFGTTICFAGSATLTAVPAWRSVLAVVLIFDIAAGCVANVTKGTDAYYGSRPTHRWVFILVHWHLVAVGALLGLHLTPVLLVTAYTLLAAAVVNLLAGRSLQVAGGGLLTAAGLVGVVLWMPASSPLFLVATAALFVVKVAFAFAVTHHARDQDQAR